MNIKKRLDFSEKCINVHFVLHNFINQTANQLIKVVMNRLIDNKKSFVSPGPNMTMLDRF